MIRALILAAGASSRMGRPKAALPLGSTGQTVLSIGIATLIKAGLPSITVVGGAHLESTRALIPRDRRVRLVENANWERGQLSSLVTGLDAIDDPQLEAVLVTLVDVPLVKDSTVRAVVEAWRASRAPIVRPVDGDRHGHPVVFDRAVFEELRQADVTVGAKAVFAAHQSEIVDVQVEDPGAFEDLDTPEDYEALQRYLQTG
jgi:CTP:molybdopterin cytidylyltransferase MocA